MTWDAAKPAGNSKIRDGDDSIRANWQALEDGINREHTFPGTIGGTAGYHKFPVVSYDPTGAEGRMAIVNNLLRYYSNGVWRNSSFPAGTSLPFYQSAAPLGWTQNTGIHDYIIRITNSTGGGAGGSWTISGLQADLAYADLPAHTHTVSIVGSGGAGNVGTAGALGQASPNSSLTTSSSGSGGGHYHSVSSSGGWRPLYIDCIICYKS